MKDKSIRQSGELERDQDLKEDLKKIVLARIQAMPDTLRISVGSKDFSKEDLIKHVEKEDEIGEQMISIELEYLQDLASGAIYGNK